MVLKNDSYDQIKSTINNGFQTYDQIINIPATNNSWSVNNTEAYICFAVHTVSNVYSYAIFEDIPSYDGADSDCYMLVISGKISVFDNHQSFLAGFKTICSFLWSQFLSRIYEENVKLPSKKDEASVSHGIVHNT